MLNVVFCSDAPPSTDLPITESVVLRQLFSSYHSCRYNVSDWIKKCLTLRNPKKKKPSIWIRNTSWQSPK